MNVLDLFSGIGGFSLGLERAGFKTVAFCEIEPYCQKVLKKHWPDVPIYNDVRELNGQGLRADGITSIDVVTGGFPCQDISVAGKQKGITGERSGLWSELHRIIDDIQPSYALLENVAALISGDRGRWFGRVLGDLAEVGYDTEWHCIPASAVGAPHRRDRVWIIAYPQSSNDGKHSSESMQRQIQQSRKRYQPSDVPNPVINRLQGRTKLKSSSGKSKTIITRSQITRAYSENGRGRGWWSIESSICRVANGIPRRVDRIKGLGNAVVPQIPELIGRAILELYD